MSVVRATRRLVLVIDGGLGHEDVGHEDVGHEDVGHEDVGHEDVDGGLDEDLDGSLDGHRRECRQHQRQRR
jgi:hypothetical protein